MDLNGDGKIDILSGSYSRHEQDMAGLFQVLWGAAGGGFQVPAVLNGTDGEPLIVAASKEQMTDKICTRPTAVDLNGDGKLDIVTGNFGGTFALFVGEGQGKFAPQHTWLCNAAGTPLKVSAHSDPFFVDWDGDGDLDLISGSSSGGVYLWTNQGTKAGPKFGDRQQLLAPVSHGGGVVPMGDEWVKGPQSATRVWVEDLNGDGKLDLLIGDSVHLSFPADGLDEATAMAKLAEWTKQEHALNEAAAPRGDAELTAAQRKQQQADFQKLWEARGKFLREDSTGFVWVLYQK